MQTDFIGGDNSTVLSGAGSLRFPQIRGQSQVARLKTQKLFGATGPVRQRSRRSKGCRRISPSSPRAILHRSLRRMGGEPDRKSTRLNSSHGYISYAVFCLKKKN